MTEVLNIPVGVWILILAFGLGLHLSGGSRR